MEREEFLNSGSTNDFLKMAEWFSPPVCVIDAIGKYHYFMKFLWMGRWGICDMNKSKILVRAKPNYLYANILPISRRFIAGNSNYGWDIYSIDGMILETLEPMSLEDANNLLDKRRHSD